MKRIKKRKRKQKNKPQSYEILKKLGNYLISGNEELLPHLTENQRVFNNNLIYRIYSLAESSPLMMIYCNKYLNTYELSQYNPKDILKTFRILYNQYNLNHSNSLYYSKYKVNKQMEFNKKISKYLTLMDIQYSYSDLLALWHLFNNNVITEIDLEKIDSILAGKEIKLKKKKSTISSIFSTNVENAKTAIPNLSEKIIGLNNQIKTYISKRQKCKQCPLFKKKKVIFESNIDDYERGVDVAFIGINPGDKEVQIDRPFIGPAGQLFRQHLQILIDKLNETNKSLRYIITNIIFCHTSNESEIKNINKITKNCKEIHDNLISLFKPKIYVLMGTKTYNAYGISGSVKSLNGKLIEEKYFPLVHPSAVIRHSKAAEKQFNEGFYNLIELLSSDSIINNDVGCNDIDNLVPDFVLPEGSELKLFSKDVTLFDITIIKDKVIYIMVDKNGKKRYIIRDYKFPVYTKDGIYKDCKLIENEVENVCYLTNEQKTKLISIFYRKIDSIIKSV